MKTEEILLLKKNAGKQSKNEMKKSTEIGMKSTENRLDKPRTPRFPH